MKANDITVTDARMKQALSIPVNNIVNETVPQMIRRATDTVSIRTGVVTKMYPYLDKFEVNLDNSEDTVLCKRLHLFGPDLWDLYTPLADRKEVNKKHEPYYVPRFKMHCAVLNIHDEDSTEHLLLGFFPNEELVGLNPAQPGNLKLSSLSSEVNQFWIKFGKDGLDLRLPKSTATKVGKLDNDMEDITYADSTDVYTKDECYNKEEVYNKEECYNKNECYNQQEVYTKEEVDELIAEKVAEAVEQIMEGRV